MSTNASQPVGRDAWKFFPILYLTLALAFLIRWGKPSPFSRVDVFSGGYLLTRILKRLRSMLRPHRAPLTAEFRRERWGSTAAPGWVGWALALTLADLAVFLDYGHWRLMPGLQQPIAQGFGLLLHIGVVLWMRWTSRYLGAAFADKDSRPALVCSGPFRYIRHPYYAAALLDKIAVALIFASLIGWLLVVPWCVLLLRQVRLEELHLRKLFGARYDAYAKHTYRLLPGVF